MSERERSTGRGAHGTSGSMQDLRAVLRIAPFRTLWIALGLSSLGDWLGLLALTAMAGQLAEGDYRAENFAIAGVLLLRLLPAVIVGPLGGYIADRLDRRWTLVVGDVIRFALFASIPVVGTLWWLFVATVLIEAVSLVWLPAKDAAVPNLVPRERLAAANQISLATTYGSALPAALLFTVLALVSSSLSATLGIFTDSVDLALYFNAATFLVGAIVVARLREVSGRPTTHEAEEQPSVIRAVVEGWQFVANNRLIRGLVIGVVGAFAAAGVVIGLGRTYVSDLGGAEAGYGVLFGALFLGLSAGMAIGPRLLPSLSRRRMFGLSLTAAGIALTAVAVLPNLVLVAFLTVLLGLFAGISWINGYTLLGLEVEDSIRGRTFAFVQSLTKIALAAVLAAAPAIAGSIGAHRVELPGGASLTYNGAAITFLLAGIAATVIGVVSYRQMDDRAGVPLTREVRAVFSGYDRGVSSDVGLFIALEGGEGGGKSTQARLLADWLQPQGFGVVVTYEPGATDVGRDLRQLLLHSGHISARAEALLYAADKAEHVDTMIRPALQEGSVVITDRYVDTMLAYQGAGRDLSQQQVLRLCRWATEGLRPHLTVLLDVPPEVGLTRGDGPPDRLEREPLEFHQRARQHFLDLAALDPDRYLVLDATAPPDQIAARIRERVEPLLVDLRVRETTGSATAEGAGVPEVSATAAGDARTTGSNGGSAADGAQPEDGAPAEGGAPAQDGAPAEAGGEGGTEGEGSPGKRNDLLRTRSRIAQERASSGREAQT
ncbi:dTMP kinase [Actinopolymorpha sp. B17G11]|uniref:dTMP kinase n=1 Tax=unclassified Actinopolymorpha TaxID=2627063 RepID=UPI0032D95C14